MSELRDNFQVFWLRYRPGLERALQYLLEDAGEANRIMAETREQAERQWVALEGDANPALLIGFAAADRCALRPRSARKAFYSLPTEFRIIRYLEWYDWERRIDTLQTLIAVREAAVHKSGNEPQAVAEVEEIYTKLGDAITMLYQMKSGLKNDDDTTGGGSLNPIPAPPPRGPGDRRTFREALAPARNP